jgi:hypothetical protein
MKWTEVRYGAGRYRKGCAGGSTRISEVAAWDILPASKNFSGGRSLPHVNAVKSNTKFGMIAIEIVARSFRLLGVAEMRFRCLKSGSRCGSLTRVPVRSLQSADVRPSCSGDLAPVRLNCTWPIGVFREPSVEIEVTAAAGPIRPDDCNTKDDIEDAPELL